MNESKEELGGFCTDIKDFDGIEEDYKCFNICLAEDYLIAMRNEDFELLGEFDPYLIDSICNWLTYDDDSESVDIANEIKNGTLITYKNRPFIDAIYENKNTNFAKTYLYKDVYSPKLILTLILSDDEDDIAYIDAYNQEMLDKILKDLYDFIEEEYERVKDKKLFLNSIKTNISKIRMSSNFKPMKASSETYSWLKELKKVK
jgi:hypothetical protein